MRIRVWRKLTNSWGWFWRRVSVNFALGFLAMGVVAALLWSFGLIDSDLRRVVLTAAIGALHRVAAQYRDAVDHELQRELLHVRHPAAG